MAAEATAADAQTVLIYRAETRRYHRRGDHPYRPACGSTHADGQQVSVADARALGFDPCQNPACFGGDAA